MPRFKLLMSSRYFPILVPLISYMQADDADESICLIPVDAPKIEIFVNSFHTFAALYFSAHPSGTFRVALVYMLLEKVLLYANGGGSSHTVYTVYMITTIERMLAYSCNRFWYYYAR